MQSFSACVLVLIKMATKQEQTRISILDKYFENPGWSYEKIGKSLKLHPRTVGRVIKRFLETKTTARKAGSGRKKGPANPKLAKQVIDYVKRHPTISNRKVAQKFAVSEFYVRKQKKNSSIKSYKVQKCPDRTKNDEKRAKSRARKLYDEFLTKNNGCLIMDDESYVYLDFRQLPGASFYSAVKRYGIKKELTRKSMSKFPKKVVVWQAICKCGLKSKIFVTKGTMNSEIYLKECLNKRLLPFIKQHKGQALDEHLFWPDLASCHYSKVVQEWYVQNNVRVVPKYANPPFVPELRPIEKYWAIIKGHLRRANKVAKDIPQFKKYWHEAANKVAQEVVQRMMEEVKKKVRLFGREGEI